MSDDNSAVGGENLSGDKVGCGGTEKQDAFGYILRGSDCAQRSFFFERFDSVGGKVSVHRGIDDAGGNAVHLDTGGTQLFG